MAVRIQNTGRDEIHATHYIDNHVKDLNVAVTAKEIMSPSSPIEEKTQASETPNSAMNDDSAHIVRHLSINAPGLKTRVEVTGK